MKDREVLERIAQLAKEGERVESLADQIANEIAETDSVDIEYLNRLGAERYEVVCGKRPIEDGENGEKLKRFWDSIRAFAAAQFGELSLGRRQATKTLLLTRRLENDGMLAPKDKIYWSFLQEQSASSDPKSPDYPFVRAAVLLSLYRFFFSQNPLTPNEKKSAEDTRAEGDVKGLLDHLRSHLKIRAGALPTANHAELMWRLRVLKLARILKMMRDVGVELSGSKELNDLEQQLRDGIALLLQGNSPDVSEVEIAAMLSVLGGRDLNPRLKLEPNHIVLYGEAVERVLTGRQRVTGSWRHEPIRRGLREDLKYQTDPLSSNYSPLVLLLDLPNSVLMSALPMLAETATEVLGTLKSRLGSYAVKLPEGQHERVNEAIYDGLMVGAAVADRFRDLVSDAELQALRADVPTRLVPWENLSDSLRFREHLYHGAIELWRNNSPERPGAILVFGPPGTGKTIIAASLLAKLNEELGQTRKAAQDAGGTRPPRGIRHEEWRFLALSPADFAREGSDRIIASAEDLFRRLQRVRRCVVLLDEMEEFLRVRGPDASRDSRLVTTAFLPLLQDTVDKREIILIVATNFVGTIDSAVARRGRFDLILPLGPPDERSRWNIIKQWLSEQPNEKRSNGVGAFLATEINEMLDNGIDALTKADQQTNNMMLICRYTMGYTWAEIRDFLNELWCSEQIRDRKTLKSELWRIRQERVPMALSGNPGCNWRTFRDEAARFRRGAAGVSADDGDLAYWTEPPMPGMEEDLAEPASPEIGSQSRAKGGQ